MVQWIKCFLHKHEELSLRPEHPCENPGMIACGCNHSTKGRGWRQAC